MSNPKFKKVKGTNSPTKNPTCGKCGKKHYGDFLKGTVNCFSCGKSDHKMKVKRRVVVKLKKVVLVMLHRRTASMLSALGVSKRLLPTW